MQNRPDVPKGYDAAQPSECVKHVQVGSISGLEGLDDFHKGGILGNSEEILLHVILDLQALQNALFPPGFDIYASPEQLEGIDGAPLQGAGYDCGYNAGYH